MRRLAVLFSAATLSLVGGVIATSAVASASTATTEPSSTATEGHPIIGTWIVTDTSDTSSPPSVTSFTSDGIVVDVETDGVGLGAWEATGPTSANVTFVESIPADEGGGTVMLRVAVEVAPDGQSFTGDYTVELGGSEGAPTGEYGPGSVTATRVAVEPMGTPVGSLNDLFGSFEEGTGAPTGTAMTDGTAMTEATDVMAPTTTG